MNLPQGLKLHVHMISMCLQMCVSTCIYIVGHIMYPSERMKKCAWEHAAKIACRHARTHSEKPPGVEPIIQPAETVADQSGIDVK